MKRLLLLAAAMVASMLAIGGTASAACVAPYCPAPTIVTGQAINITDTSATLTGAINPNLGGPVQWNFTSPDFSVVYGSGTVPDGNAGSVVSTTLTNLAPSTTYSYRLIGSNGSSPRYGDVLTFTTLATGASGGGGTPSTNPTKVDPNKVSISASPRRDRRAPFRYTITGGVEVDNGALCASGGDVTIRFSRGRTLVTKTVTLEADCGYTATVGVPRDELPRRRSGRINVRASFAGNDALNAASSETIKVRFR